MHPLEVREAALKLIAAGINDCEISRRMGIPRATIRDWRRPTYVPREPVIPRETCPCCWRAAKPIRFTPRASTLGVPPRLHPIRRLRVHQHKNRALWQVRINRRDSVAKMVAQVGLKR